MIALAPSSPTFLGERYQVLRRLGGDDSAPLCIASDLTTGSVVCLRMWSLSSRLAQRAAVPRLAARTSRQDVALLPYAFGVHQDIAYTVRTFQTGLTLNNHLVHPETDCLAERVRLMRSVAEGIREAHRRGFANGNFDERNILVDQRHRIGLTGFDRPPWSQSPDAELHDIDALFVHTRRLLTTIQAPNSTFVQHRLENLLSIIREHDRGLSVSVSELLDELRPLERSLARFRRHALPERTKHVGLHQGWHRLQRVGMLSRTYVAAAGLLALVAAGGYELTHTPSPSLKHVTLLMWSGQPVQNSVSTTVAQTTAPTNSLPLGVPDRPSLLAQTSSELSPHGTPVVTRFSPQDSAPGQTAQANPSAGAAAVANAGASRSTAVAQTRTTAQTSAPSSLAPTTRSTAPRTAQSAKSPPTTTASNAGTTTTRR